MMHKPIQITNLSLLFSHKTCFEDFNIQIYYGSRIAIIGRNGCGKTTLLKILHGLVEPTGGAVLSATDINMGYVPQTVEDFQHLSGGQRLNASLTKALSFNPDLLLLDEPTNHLDGQQRKSLLRMLQSYTGTLIVVSHDTELLRYCIDTLWHIDDGKICVFDGSYDDYVRDIEIRRSTLEQQITRLNRKKKEMHHALMKEQNRAAKSRIRGEKNIKQRKWPTVVSAAKAGRGESTSGRKKFNIENKKMDLTDQLSKLWLPEKIAPKFSLTSAEISDRSVLSIRDGTVSYVHNELLLQNINFTINSKARIAIKGDNASGKTTLIKAIMNDVHVIKTGIWNTPNVCDIGYLDQHYGTLPTDMTVLEMMATFAPTWTPVEVRRHLSDFLFRKNEEVHSQVKVLSGGEKVRLSLAQIAACTPKLLILDEITNNLDLETKAHVGQVLSNYPGAMLIISHDEEFLKIINVECYYQIVSGSLEYVHGC